MGYSEFSTESYIAFGDVPNTPDAPLRTASTRTSISVQWSAPAAGDLDVSGYILNMDDGFKTDLKPVYIGYNRPDVLSFTVGGLTTGLPYRFSVQAVNVNGISEESDMSTFFSCEAPSSLKEPYYISSDEFTMEIVIGWQAPLLDGGCPVLGYEVYRNDGDSEAVDTIIDSIASDNPSLSTATVDLSTDGTIGSIYKFKVRAINYAGTQDSSALSVALASLPD